VRANSYYEALTLAFVMGVTVDCDCATSADAFVQQKNMRCKGVHEGDIVIWKHTKGKKCGIFIYESLCLSDC
jgi:hypothetical protein